MKEFEVVLFHKDNGESPVEEFIDTLEPKMQAKVLRTMELLKRNGLELREPYTKSLGRGIFELRAKHGTDISRVLYFFMEGHRIIFTNGFIKKTDKTPKQEIELARKYRREYKRRWS
ncbi:MAG: type II toxin-antitoxin system RelE/ParE family toxin [Hungatella hathewayi]|nr:type II toxin-antitoxin system RelE/ParE family toxin [Hungatella hathewayi]